jgi:hypothetical protein
MTARDTRGQAAVLTIVFMTVLLGASAMALDVGSWFHARRELQAQADAAALAGAQALPNSTADAQSLAIQYASKNGGTLTASGVTFSSSASPDDTISVRMAAPTPGYFSKLFGLDTVTVHAQAAARTDNFNEALFASPIGVDFGTHDLSGSGCPCFGGAETLTLDKVGPGGFRLLNIDGSTGGTNPNTLADWMENGLDAYMGLGDYYSDPGSKFNSGGFKQALTDNIGKELLFPVYDRVDLQGSNLYYHVIGWVGFVITSFSVSGKGTLQGYFTRVIWQGIQGHTGTGPPNSSADLGAYSVQLVN